MLPGDIGYMVVPGFEGSEGADAEAFSNVLDTGTVRVAGSASHGWIIDLRSDPLSNISEAIASGPWP